MTDQTDQTEQLDRTPKEAAKYSLHLAWQAYGEDTDSLMDFNLKTAHVQAMLAVEDAIRELTKIVKVKR